ncbi:MAG: PD-(D/E)XK nuclease family protein [Planctomycetota bacterium]
MSNAPPRFVAAPDLRRLEDDLLRAVDREDERVAEDPARLARAAWIVVPSRSLLLHLQRRLAGRTRLGWRLVTLPELARQVLKRHGEALSPGDLALEVAVRRAARAHAALTPVARTEAGLDAIAATVRDLLDAGLDAHERESWSEALGDEPRVEALIDVALLAREDLGARGRLERGAVLRRAADVLDDGAVTLDARALFIHGFADVTYGAGRLIGALARDENARVWLELPDGENHFVERMRDLLASSFGAPVAVADEEHATTLDHLAGRDRVDVCERVARGAHDAIAGGMPPEDIAIVVREPAPPALGFALRRQGVPFSSVGATRGATGEARRIEALLTLLAEGGRTTLERFALTVPARPSALLAFQMAGAARLDDLASIDWTPHLSRRSAHEVALKQAAPGQGRLAHRRVAAEELDRVREHWLALTAEARDLARMTLWSAARDALSSFASERLGWDETRLLDRVLNALDREFDDEDELEFPELLRLLERALHDLGAGELGGAGGGVQILSMTEARARTFGRLFVVGLERGAFPRIAPIDPLMPDEVRGRLTPLVPEFPVKARSYDEERFQLASMLGAARHATLMWATDDGEGRALVAAPLVERLIGERGADELELSDDDVRDPIVAAGLSGDRDAWRAALANTIPPGDAAHLAAVVAEFEAPPDPPRLGPWQGLVGAQPRPARIFVTRLEGWQKCPWKYLLEKVLQIEPRPDALGALPDFDARTIGSAVHQTLERCLGAVDGEGLALDEALALARTTERRARLADQVLTEVAAELARKEGVRWAGFAPALVQLALPYVRVAQAAIATPLVAEVECALSVPAGDWGTVELRARIDLVEERDGALVGTDFKTGKRIHGTGDLPKSDAKRMEHLQGAVAKGTHLQAVAYAEALGQGAKGRYLFLHPDLSHEAPEREALAPNGDPALLALFGVTVERTLGGMASGIHTARLLAPKGRSERLEPNPACENCEVRTACSNGDTQAKRRFEALLTSAAHSDWSLALDPHRQQETRS